MFRNYFNIGVRSLLKHKVFALVNVVGLALGFAAFMLIMEFVSFERGFDSDFSLSTQTYRLSTQSVVNDVVDTKDAMSFYPAAARVQADIPEILNTTISLKMDELVFRNGNSLV